MARYLKYAIKYAGSRAALARVLGVKPSAVRAQSFAKRYAAEIQAYVERRRAEPDTRIVRRSFERAVKRAGSKAALARALGVSPGAVKRALTGAASELLKLRLAEVLKAEREAPRIEKKPAPRIGKRDLERALKQAGTKAALARELGVSRDALRRMLKEGLPPRLKALLNVRRVKVREHAEREKAAAPERREFTELLEAAGELHDKHGFPVVRDLVDDQGPREGSYTRGYFWKRSIKRRLTDAVSEDILKWADSRQRLKRAEGDVWQTFLYVVSHDPLGKKAPGGSPGPIILQVNPERLKDFVMVGEIITPRRDHDGMCVELQDRLQDLLNGGLYVFIVGATIWNYNVRSVAERLAWQAEKKRKGKKWPIQQRKP